MSFTAHKYWDERILTAFASRRNIYSEQAIGGESETGVAVVKLANTDGTVDGWLSLYSFNNQDAVLWMGTDVPGVTFADLLADPKLERNWLAQLTPLLRSDGSTTTVRLSSQGYSPSTTEAPAGYGEVFRGVVSDEPLPGLNVADLILRDKQGTLDEAPHRPVYMGGTDGILLQDAGRASIGSAAEVELTGDMCASIRINATTKRHVSLLGWGAGLPAQFPWHLLTLSPGGLRFRYTHSSGTGTFKDSTSSQMFSAGSWYNVGFRIDGDELYFFSQNMGDRTVGVIWDGPHTLDAATRDAASGATFFLGWTSAQGFEGYVTEARVWNGSGGTDYRRVLEQRFTPANIPGSDVFKDTAGTIVGYWKADEGSGTNLGDSSVSANTLALTGTYLWDFPLGGGVDLAGVEMPLAFGRFLHAPLVLVDASKLIFQVHSRSIASITELLENGGDIAADSTTTWVPSGGTTVDAPTLADFLGTAPANGKYKTYLAQGLIRIGSATGLQGALQVSGTGDNEGGYVSTAADIIERMTIDFGPHTAADINSTSFSDFNTATGSAVNGLVIPAGDQTELSAHADSLLVGAAGWWIFARDDGEMELAQFTDPKDDVSTPKKIYDYDIQRDGIVPLSLKPPSRRQSMGYARTWGPLNAEGLIGTAADARIDELSESYRWIESSEPSILVENKGAEDPDPIGTTLTARDDCYNACVDRQHLYGTTGRRMFQIKLKTAPDTFELGDLVKVYHERYGWTDGELFRVVQVDEGSTVIRIWG